MYVNGDGNDIISMLMFWQGFVWSIDTGRLMGDPIISDLTSALSHHPNRAVARCLLSPGSAFRSYAVNPYRPRRMYVILADDLKELAN